MMSRAFRFINAFTMLATIRAKIQTMEQAHTAATRWRANNERIVFTNGCFDLLHYGHISYLARARALGDRLIVGLNSTASVRRLKGNHRPINDETTRSMVLAALAAVDLVVIFEEDTPLRLIQTLQPDVLCKGGDYTPDRIVGAATVIERGGRVITLPFENGYSTTQIEERIKNL